MVMVVMMVQSTREASIDKIGTVYVLQLQLCIWLQLLCHILFTFSSFVRFPDGILCSFCGSCGGTVGRLIIGVSILEYATLRMYH